MDIFQQIANKRRAIEQGVQNNILGSMSSGISKAKQPEFEKVETHSNNDEFAKAYGELFGDLEKARQVGDIHANGKWVWTEYKPGKFDWRPRKDGNAKPAAKASVISEGIKKLMAVNDGEFEDGNGYTIKVKHEISKQNGDNYGVKLTQQYYAELYDNSGKRVAWLTGADDKSFANGISNWDSKYGVNFDGVKPKLNGKFDAILATTGLEFRKPSKSDTHTWDGLINPDARIWTSKSGNVNVMTSVDDNDNITADVLFVDAVNDNGDGEFQYLDVNKYDIKGITEDLEVLCGEEGNDGALFSDKFADIVNKHKLSNKKSDPKTLNGKIDAILSGIGLEFRKPTKYEMRYYGGLEDPDARIWTSKSGKVNIMTCVDDDDNVIADTLYIDAYYNNGDEKYMGYQNLDTNKYDIKSIAEDLEVLCEEKGNDEATFEKKFDNIINKHKLSNKKPVYPKAAEIPDKPWPVGLEQEIKKIPSSGLAKIVLDHVKNIVYMQFGGSHKFDGFDSIDTYAKDKTSKLISGGKSRRDDIILSLKEEYKKAFQAKAIRDYFKSGGDKAFETYNKLSADLEKQYETKNTALTNEVKDLLKNHLDIRDVRFDATRCEIYLNNSKQGSAWSDIEFYLDKPIVLNKNGTQGESKDEFKITTRGAGSLNDIDLLSEEGQKALNEYIKVSKAVSNKAVTDGILSKMQEMKLFVENGRSELKKKREELNIPTDYAYQTAYENLKNKNS